MATGARKVIVKTPTRMTSPAMATGIRCWIDAPSLLSPNTSATMTGTVPAQKTAITAAPPNGTAGTGRHDGKRVQPTAGHQARQCSDQECFAYRGLLDDGLELGLQDGLQVASHAGQLDSPTQLAGQRDQANQDH